MKKSLVTLIALLGLVLTGWADQTWKTSVASGLYSEPTNWKASVVPVNGELGIFDTRNATEETSVYTVGFPLSGFTDTSATYLYGLKDGQKLVFDVTGRTWYKGPGALSASKCPISLRTGGSKDFLTLNNAAANTTPAFLMTNGILSCSYSATLGSFVEFRGGDWNWLDPNDIETPAALKLIIGQNDTNVSVRVCDGATLHTHDIQVCDGTFEIFGGTHAVKGSSATANAINLGGKSERDPLMVLSNATVNLAQGRVAVGSTANAKATLELAGSARIPDVTRLYVGLANNVEGVMRLAGTSSVNVTDRLCVGSDYDGNSAAHGRIELTDQASLTVKSARIGYLQSSKGAADERGEISLNGHSTLTYTGNGTASDFVFMVGDLGAGTGVVSVAGHAQLIADKSVEKRPYVRFGSSTTGCGILNATDDAVLDLFNVYLGCGGNYEVNLSGRAALTTPYYAGSWDVGGLGTSTFGGQSVATIATMELGKNGTDDLIVKDSATVDVTSNFKLCTAANGSASALVRDAAALSVVNAFNVGLSSGTKSARFRLQDQATVTAKSNVMIQGADSQMELAGGAMTMTRTTSGYALSIAAAAGGVGVLRVTGGDHDLKAGGGIKVLSDAAATATTEGRVELLGGRVAIAKMFGGDGSVSGGGRGKAILSAAGGTVVPTVADETLIEKFDEATLGAGGLTIEVPAEVPVKVAQAFTDGTPGEGVIVKAGAGTLTATVNSAHGVTRIEGGTVTFGAGVTEFGKSLVLAGGTYTVDGEFPFEALQLGDAGSVGTLVLATPGKLPITDAAKFAVSNGVIRFTASPALGDYAFIELTGDVDRTMFDRLAILDPDGSNRYGFTFDAEGGKTTVTLKVVDVSSITDVTWAGTESGAWATDANWIGGSKATALNNAVFPAEATTKQVAVDRNEAADQLKFTGGEYAVSGEGQLTTYGMLVTNGATATVSAPVVPKGSFSLDVAEDAALDFASPFAGLSAGELVKKGLGPLALTGSRTLNTLDWNLRGGRTTVTNDAAIGGPVASVTIGACTLGFPEGGTYAHDVALDAGSTDQFSVMDVAQDTVISGALDSVSGAFIKRGTGTLEVDYPAGSYVASVGQGAFDRNITPNVAKWSVPLVFPENGESPVISTDGGANNVGLGGFNVAEGLVRLKGDSATTLAQTNWTVVGVNYPEQAAEAELEISGLTFDNSTASARANFRRFVIGQRTNKDVPFRHPTLRVIDGATLKAQGIWLGTAYDADTYPTLAVTNATVTVDSQFYVNLGDGNNQKCHPVIRVGPGGAIGFTASAQQDWRYTLCVGMFTDCDVDGGSITIPSGLPGGVLIGYTACGCLAFRNGGTFEFPMLQTRDNKNSEKKMTDLVFAFDNGVMKLNKTGESIISAPSTRYVQIEDGGLTVEVGDGLMHTMRLPFRGTGALTKTGAGTFVLGVGKENLYSAYPSSGTPTNTVDSGLTTAAYAGKTTVAEGTLVFEEGELVATKEVEVAAGATLELSNAETAYGFETLSGAGTIRNGAIGNCAIACNGTSAPTFDNVTLGAVTVDFGHDETDPIDLATLAGLKVAQLDNGSTATKWKIAGTGHKNVRGTFVIQPDGSVVLAEACLTGLLMIVR